MSRQAPVYLPEAAAQFEAAASRVRAAEKISVVAHIKPDADAIGSACALAFGLEKLGKDVEVYIGQPLPHSANMRTIPGVDRIHYGAPLPDDLSLIHI